MNNPGHTGNEIFVARRVTRALLEELIPGSTSVADVKATSPSSVITKIYEAAKFAGVSISNALGGVLSFGGDRSIKSYNADKKRGGRTNLFGSYLVCLQNDKITIIDGKGFLAPPKDGELFIIADFVGLPIARINGSIGSSSFSVLSQSGQSKSGEYAIDLWIDGGSDEARLAADRTSMLGIESRVGRFLNALMRDKDDLDLTEFKKLSAERLQPLIAAMTDAPPPNLGWDQSLESPSAALESALANFQEGAERLLGVSSFVRFRPGRRIFRHSITIDTDTSTVSRALVPDSYTQVDHNKNTWKCGSCSTLNSLHNSFCLECGGPKPSTMKEQRSRNLISIDGEELVFDLSFETYDQSQVDTDAIAARCFEIMRPLCRQQTLESIGFLENLKAIGVALNSAFITNQFGPVGNFGIVDFRSSKTEWQLETRAMQNSASLYLDRRFAELELDSRELAAIAAERLSRERKLEQQRADLETQRKYNDLSVEEFRAARQLEADTDRVDRDLQRKLEKDTLSESREDTIDARIDQISQFVHESSLDKKVQVHELDMEQQRVAHEADIEDRLAQLRASRNIGIARMEQALELEKMRGNLDIEVSKKTTETELEILKLRAMSEIDLAQRDQLKGLTPSQILALQAGKLADAGATDAIKELASHNAAAAQALIEARTNEARAELLQEMLKMQSGANSEANARQFEMMKQALDAQISATQRVEQAHQKSTENAERWNEKSIDAIAKVASVKLGEKGIPLKADEKSQSGKFSCSSCNQSIDISHKFCPSCGQLCNSSL